MAQADTYAEAREPDVGGRWPGRSRLALIVGGSGLLWALIIAAAKLLLR